MQINGISSESVMNSYNSAQNKVNGDFADKLAKATSEAATGSKDAKADAKLKDTCQQMEAVFINMLLTCMRTTVPKDSLLGDSSAEETMQSLADSETSKNMAKAGGMGLADMLYRQLSSTVVSNPKSQAPR
jgi:flagellar protein FlgJ